MLTDKELMEKAPSIFSVSAYQARSEKYVHIPTIDVVRTLSMEGFYAVSAFQSRSRFEDRRKFLPHCIRFRHKDMPVMEGVISEIVLTNSHNGFSKYSLCTGLYRKVCDNGLWAYSVWGKHIKHCSGAKEEVLKGATEILQTATKPLQIAQKWVTLEVKPVTMPQYLNAVVELRFPEKEVVVEIGDLLKTRRVEDQGRDLWTVFNVLQENLSKGGISYRDQEGKVHLSRCIRTVPEVARFNNALWELTQNYADSLV